MTLSPSTPVESVMSVFTSSKIALVTESTGEGDDRKPVGILTQIDLLDLLAGR
ncbi:MAG: CBS domain-containing protein [Chloroflexi bacterium]|nr:CBS domain-containing protein [Chloroflexota bacterium]